MSLTRHELLTKLGIVKNGPNLDAWTEKACLDYEEKVWRDALENSPHGNPWHTSFHASGFPGAEKSCGRSQMYMLMDIPGNAPTPPKLRGQGEVGKAVEYLVVHRWGVAGMTIAGSVPIWYGAGAKQVGFEHRGLWLTGSGDAVLDLRPDWPAVLPVDVKSKDDDKIEEMKLGMRSYDDSHYAQIQAYIYLARIFHEDMGWKAMGLEEAVGGIIYYCSRQNPRNTFEFYVDADWDFIHRGIENLRQWQENFKSGTLPERDKSWKWTEDPCKWCRWKKFACKPDVKDGTTRLEDSNAIKFASEIRRNYNYEEMRQEVLDRWS